MISQHIAEKYFGHLDPIGEILYLNHNSKLTVTGVFAEFPQNSHLDFDFIISFETFRVPQGYPVTLQTWSWASFPTYLELNKNVDLKNIEEKCTRLVSQNLPEGAKQRFFVVLQPLNDVYLGKYVHESQKKETGVKFTD